MQFASDRSTGRGKHPQEHSLFNAQRQHQWSASANPVFLRLQQISAPCHSNFQTRPRATFPGTNQIVSTKYTKFQPWPSSDSQSDNPIVSVITSNSYDAVTAFRMIVTILLTGRFGLCSFHPMILPPSPQLGRQDHCIPECGSCENLC